MYRRLRPQDSNHPAQAWSLSGQAWLGLDMNESTSVPFGVKSQALFTVQRCIQLKEVGPIREVSTIICHPKKKREEGREGKRREEKGEKRQSLLRIPFTREAVLSLHPSMIGFFNTFPYNMTTLSVRVVCQSVTFQLVNLKRVW